jgi:hypothetical protein
MNYDIVFLLEESSIKNVLEELLPKLILREISYICISHQGKQAERGTRRLKSIYHKLFMVLALKSSPHHLSLINNNS